VPGGDLPVFDEASEVVDAEDIVHTEAVTDAVDPPSVSCFFHGIPVVDGIAPELARGIELVGGETGDVFGFSLFGQFEYLAVGPQIGAVVPDIHGDIADDLDSGVVAVGFQRAPLPAKGVLDELFALNGV